MISSMASHTCKPSTVNANAKRISSQSALRAGASLPSPFAGKTTKNQRNGQMSLRCSPTCSLASSMSNMAMPTPTRQQSVVCKAAAVTAPVDQVELWSEDFTVDDIGGLSTTVYEQADSFVVDITPKGLPESTLLHWSANDWNLPDRSFWPEGTNQIDDQAVQTPLSNGVIRLEMAKDVAPRKIVFVLKVTSPEEKWYNNGSSFIVNVKPPQISDIFEKALDAEGTWDTYTLLARYQLAMELIGQAEKVEGGDAMGFIYTWLRMSNLKLLDWYRNGNYQSKDMGHIQKAITEQLCAVVRTAQDPVVRRFARMSLSGMSRGGGDAEAIRLEILNIFRKNGVKEGHRPGIDDPFLAQWHQKLHSNTTVEDIAICEAYIHFLCSSGDPGEFWHHLWEYGGISRERMASMKCGWRSDGIKSDPLHLTHMVDDMKHYLWILKTVHAGADMETMLVMAQGHLDGELVGGLWDVVHNQGEWWVGGKALEMRQALEPYWRNGTGGRDVMLLDCALEKFVRLTVERSDMFALGRDDLINVAELLMKSGAIAGESEELGVALQGWQKMMAMGDSKWGGQGALQAYATLERTSLALSEYMDEIYTKVQPHAEAIGAAANVDTAYTLNFGEECVRGHPLFQLSTILQLLRPQMRQAAGLSPWQVVSSAEAVSGEVLAVDLSEIQGQVFDTPTIVVTGAIGGLEDIPQGVVGVVVGGGVDVLSHLAIRARNQKVLCVCCEEDKDLQDLRGLAGSFQKFTLAADGSVSATPTTAEAASPSAAVSGEPSKSAAGVALRSPAQEAKEWIVKEADFSTQVVGGKGLHLSELRAALPANLEVPQSLAVPFGAFERCLADPANAQVAESVAASTTAALAAKEPQEVMELLDDIRSQVVKMTAPSAFQAELQAAAPTAGMETLDFDMAWEGICKVWASQFTDRAWFSRRAMGLEEKHLRMSCLLQRVVPAKYAFVLHTANPLTGDKDQILGEVVVGLGENLVNNSPGQAMSFTCDKAGGAVTLTSLPSKRTALYSPGATAVIARSDSNAEDLEDFAGAGLYDSVLVGEEPNEAVVNYTDEALVWDDNMRNSLIAQLAQAGTAIEKALGGAPQDIEGAIDANGTIHIVQSRPEILG